MSDTTWRIIPDFPDYEASNTGKIRRATPSPHSHGCNELRPLKMVRGYLKVILYRNKKRCQQYVHQLVLRAFAGPPPDGYVCNHKDGDRHNNHLDNLEWITVGDNIRHAAYVLKSLRGHPKMTPDQVREIRHLYLTGNYTQKQLGVMYGIDASAISNIIRRRNWSHIE